MESIIKKSAALLLAVILLMAAASCSGATNTSASVSAPAQSVSAVPDDKDVDGKLILDHEDQLEYATEFKMTHYKGGYIKFTVSSASDKEFLIVPKGKSVPAGLDSKVVVLQQPLARMCINSTGLVSLVDAIGGLDRVTAVGYDVGSWYLDNVIASMKAGKIKYSGKYSAPDFEMLTKEGIQLEIDTTMLDGYPDVMAKYDELKIPYFRETSSREGNPMGRVEWVKLFGALAGLEDEANAYFNKEAAKVNAVTSSEKTNKTVAMFYMSTGSDKVYARNGGDYMAAMIKMAGGSYIMSDVNPDKTSTTATTFEDVYSRCAKADYLFYVNFALKFDSVAEMVKYNPLFADFKAVKEGRVYVTSPDFTQSTAEIADIIADMNTILKDPSKTTGSLIKLK
jgi:iron complex transport system substrate-binding protein